MNKAKNLQSKQEPATAEEALSPITLVRDLQSGKISASSLSTEARQVCVEYLGNEGYSVGEIAEVLKISIRTIHRDRDQIKAAHAVGFTPDMVEQQIGQLVQHADQAIQRLRRIAREKECPHAARVEAVRGTWTVVKELTELLQHLGYLPTAAHQIRADLTHHIDEPPSFDQMQMEVARLELLIKLGDKTDEKTMQVFTELKTTLKQFAMSTQIKQLTDALGKGGDNDADTK
jgi:transposase